MTKTIHHGDDAWMNSTSDAWENEYKARRFVVQPTAPAQERIPRQAVRHEPGVLPYEFIKKLGEGSFGTVHLSRDPQGHYAAIKEMTVSGNMPPLEFVSMVEDEIYLNSILTGDACHVHMHVVCIKDAFYRGEKETFYIVMDYIENHWSKLAAANQKEDVIRKREMMIGALEALKYIHALGVLHRDIKPANMFYDGNRIMFADFGISCFLEHCTGRAGTIAYMDPTVRYGTRTELETSDIYSLGVAFYELMFNKPYHRSDPVQTDYDIRRAKFLQNLTGYAYQHERDEVTDLFDDLESSLVNARVDIYTEATVKKTFANIGSLIYAMLDPDPLTRIKLMDAINHLVVNE